MLVVDNTVAIIIFLILLVVTIFVIGGLIQNPGDRLNLENELRKCCTNYRSHGCPDYNTPQFNKVYCDGQTPIDELIDSVLGDPSIVENMNRLKAFCRCPQ